MLTRKKLAVFRGSRSSHNLSAGSSSVPGIHALCSPVAPGSLLGFAGDMLRTELLFSKTMKPSSSNISFSSSPKFSSSPSIEWVSPRIRFTGLLSTSDSDSERGCLFFSEPGESFRMLSKRRCEVEIADDTAGWGRNDDGAEWGLVMPTRGR